MLITTFTTIINTITIIIIISVMAVRPGLSFSLVTGSGYSGYTDTMCGATFTDRCPQLSKGGSICVTMGGGGSVMFIEMF